MKIFSKNALAFGLSSVFGLLLSSAALGQYYDPDIEYLLNGPDVYNHPTGKFAKSKSKAKKTSAGPSIEAVARGGATIQAVPAAPLVSVGATPANTIYMSDEYNQGEINLNNGNIQNAGDRKCRALQKYTDGYTTVFNTGDFRMSGAGKTVEINVTSNTLILDDGGSDSVLFKCTVTQGASSKPCSHTEELILAASIQPGQVVMADAFSYTGFATVDSSIDTSVIIEFATVRGLATAVVCSSNLNVRYR